MIGGEHYLHKSTPMAVVRRNIAVLGNALCEYCVSPARPMVIGPYCPSFLPENWPAIGMLGPSLLSDLNLAIPCDDRYNEHAMPFIGEIIASCLPQ